MIMIMLITITCFFAYNYFVRISVKKPLFLASFSSSSEVQMFFFNHKKQLDLWFFSGFVCIFFVFAVLKPPSLLVWSLAANQPTRRWFDSGQVKLVRQQPMQRRMASIESSPPRRRDVGISGFEIC